MLNQLALYRNRKKARGARYKQLNTVVVVAYARTHTHRLAMRIIVCELKKKLK